MKNKKTAHDKPGQDSSTKKSVQTGQKAIKAELAIRGKSKQAREDEKKDAEKWRSEG